VERRHVTPPVRRAGAFAAVGTISLVVPFGAAPDASWVRAITSPTGLAPPAVAAILAAAPFLLIGAIALRAAPGGLIFELFARPTDRQDSTLYGLAGFALAAAGLALLAVRFGFPVWVFVGSVLALAYGNLAAVAVRVATEEPVIATAAFVVGGAAAATIGQAVAATQLSLSLSGPFVAEMAFLGTTGALLGALLRVVLFERDDPLVMLSIGLLLWLLSDLPLAGVTTTRIAVALGVTVLLGYVSYALETASIPGMVTGVLLGLLTMVLGDFRWFALLITFFGLGGLAAKFKYAEKQRRGIAEDNEGARGSGNVLANSLVALVAVLGAEASEGYFAIESTLFLFAFAGALAAAMSDTFSSEFGGLFDAPRLITTFERVDPGTDGAVTWQGEVAGIVGAGIIAGLTGGLFEVVGPSGTGVVLLGGVVGMTTDSLLGATVEGGQIGNQSVNLLATMVAAVVAVALALGLGMG
jgi:uncharacterized protein (TIGR00297 family)